MLFVEAPLADTVLGGLAEAGRVRLSATRMEPGAVTAAPQGEEVRFTVQSARLDAIVADGFHSRGRRGRAGGQAYRCATRPPCARTRASRPATPSPCAVTAA